jgi:hypothetical protein
MCLRVLSRARLVARKRTFSFEVDPAIGDVLTTRGSLASEPVQGRAAQKNNQDEIDPLIPKQNGMGELASGDEHSFTNARRPCSVRSSRAH